MPRGKKSRNKIDQTKDKRLESINLKIRKSEINEQTLSNLFRNDEIHELRKQLKTKDLSKMPLILGAVILEKFDIVKKLVKNGHDVNEMCFDNSTPITWAVKSKNLEMIEVLLLRGADPMITDENGDNVVFSAINCKQWDEHTFIDFLHLVKKFYKIDSNYANKNGNTLIHFAAKRQWCVLLETLIENEADVNARNSKGVTALMMAGTKSDLKTVLTLLKGGAKIFLEDNKGCTAFCYAISNISHKKTTTPYKIIDAMTQAAAINKNRNDMNILFQYVEKRLDFLVTPPEEFMKSYHSIVYKIIVPIINFFIRHLHCGLEILLEAQVFHRVKKACEKHNNNTEYLRSLMRILVEILRYCGYRSKESSCVVPAKRISDAFIDSGVADYCVAVLKKYTDSKSMIANIVTPLFFACVTEGKGKDWLRHHHEQLAPFFKDFIDISNMNFKIKEDEAYSQTVKDKIKTFKTLFKELECETSREKESTLEEEHNEPENIESIIPKFDTETKKNSKRVRRKARALRAKIDKIRSANIVERLTSKTSLNLPLTLPLTLTLPTITTIHQTNTEKEEDEKENMKGFKDDFAPKAAEWHSSIWNLPRIANLEMIFGWFPKTQNQKKVEETKETYDCDRIQIFDGQNIFKSHLLLDSKVSLSEFERYLKALPFDPESCLITRIQNSTGPIQSCIGAKAIKLQNLYGDVVGRYVDQWKDERGMKPNSILPTYEKLHLDSKNIKRQQQLHVMDELLTNHRVRGETNVLDADEDEFYDGPPLDDKFGIIGDHVKNVRKQTNEEVSSPFPFRPRKLHVQLQVHVAMTAPALPSSASPQVRCSRWDPVVQSLQLLPNRQSVCRDELFLSSPESRDMFVLSRGGSFGDVELALDRFGQPYTVKRVKRNNYRTCKALQTYTMGLTEFRHRNILPYSLCEYASSDGDLLLVTPLCEYNLGEYVMWLKLRRFAAGSEAVARQILSGLRYLHEHSEYPVAHGNLKPSNVLVDAYGNARLSEFGIHKALYLALGKDENPGQSSAIWFAPETYSGFARDRTIRCSIASDIHVAGMLLYFSLTGGLHPYGHNAEHIFEQLMNGDPYLSPLPYDAEDLVNWMLAFEPRDRPSIRQAMTHVYFWDSARRWRFLLSCAGVDARGVPLPLDLEAFHEALGDLALFNNITGDWASVIVARFPEVRLGEPNNTPIGLLKFLRICIEQCISNSERIFHDAIERDLKHFFLEHFPALPLSLFRIIEPTAWMRHPIFQQFAYPDPNFF